VTNLNGNQQRALQFERTSPDKLAHITAFDVLHGNKVQPFGFIEIEDRADVGMVQ